MSAVYIESVLVYANWIVGFYAGIHVEQHKKGFKWVDDSDLSWDRIVTRRKVRRFPTIATESPIGTRYRVELNALIAKLNAVQEFEEFKITMNALTRMLRPNSRLIYPRHDPASLLAKMGHPTTKVQREK